MAVAFFDFDKTLIDCNSGKLWIRAEVKAGRMKLRTAAWGSWHMFRYHMGTGNLEPVFEAAVSTLRGESESDLMDRTERWFNLEVRHHARPGAIEAVERHRAAGDRMVIATSSSNYQAEMARRLFEMHDAIGTVFEAVDGRFTGRVGSWAFGDHKADRVKEWSEREGIDLSTCSFYTDSITDLRCLELVRDPVAVNPDPKLEKLAQERGWRIVDWGSALVA